MRCAPVAAECATVSLHTVGSGASLPDDARRAPTWFDVADRLADDLVPAVADWVLLHVRAGVLAAARAGHPLPPSLLAPPSAGELMEVAALRHRDPELEVALAGLLDRLAPRVGDPYGSGRVIVTGTSRVAAEVDPAHLKAIATGPENLRCLLELDLGGAVVVPVVHDGLVLGALNLVRSRGETAAQVDLAEVEELGRRLGAALVASLPATALLRERMSPPAPVRWTPVAGLAVPSEARRWVRRTLPEVVDRPARTGLADDLDVVVSELVGNALRHGGGLRSVALRTLPDAVRLVVQDRTDRSPVRRDTGADDESGRGMAIVEVLSVGWGTEHDVDEPGKAVWADLAR